MKQISPSVYNSDNEKSMPIIHLATQTKNRPLLSALKTPMGKTLNNNQYNHQMKTHSDIIKIKDTTELRRHLTSLNKKKERTNDSTNIWDKSVKVEESSYYWNNSCIILEKPTGKTGKLTVAELFCGCGGTSMGFEMAGFHIAIGADIHIPSWLTFTSNHPCSSAILGDVRKIKSSYIKDTVKNNIDVLIAGVPCQGFSLNNRKRHSGDERNFLYKEFVRIIKDLKPKAIVLENVSGMRSADNGKFIRLIEKDLSKASGMKVKSKMLFARDYGVPQNRKRLIFVGVKGEEFDFDKVAPTHGVEGKPPFVTIQEAIGDLPSIKSGETAVEYRSRPSCTYQRLMRKKAPAKIQNHTAPNHPAATIDKIRSTKPGEPLYPRFKQRIRLAWDIQSPTQVSGGIRPQFQFGHPEDTRGLTIRERCRIQSFPDHFLVSGGTVQGRVQTGNAVPPLLAKAVAKAIKSYLK